MTQKEKTKFRSSATWKNFRKRMKKECNNTDLITNKKLYKGCNLHHKDLDPEHYRNLSNTDNFIFLNKQTHQFVHWLFNYYKHDHEVIDRIEQLMAEMEKINRTI